MAPLNSSTASKPTDESVITLESWSQGFMMGAVVIMIGMTLANMRKKNSLHKLILLELLLVLPNCLFNFFDPPVWGWYLSSTAVLMIASWTLHNVIAWIKSSPFLQQTGRRIYIYTVALAQLYWVVELYANFAYFNKGHGRLFNMTRPFEPLFRDPWWIFTTANLFWNIKHRYSLTLGQIIRISPRFAILLVSMGLSIIFLVLEVLAVTPVLSIGGINPYWKFSSVFKCLTDTLILDDFKSALDKLSHYRLDMINGVRFGSDHTGVHSRWHEMDRRPRVATSESERAALGSFEHVEQVEMNEHGTTSSNSGINMVTQPSRAIVSEVDRARDKGVITVHKQLYIIFSWV